jgi:hypothetical protein
LTEIIGAVGVLICTVELLGLSNNTVWLNSLKTQLGRSPMEQYMEFVDLECFYSAHIFLNKFNSNNVKQFEVIFFQTISIGI